MVRRKLSASASSSTLLNFFASSSSRSQRSDPNAVTQSGTLTKHSASRPILDGSSRETALSIEDSSGDEQVHQDSVQRLVPPRKKSRRLDSVKVECDPISFNFASNEKVIHSSPAFERKSKLIVLDDDDEDCQPAANWVMGDEEMVEPIEDRPEVDLRDEGRVGDEYDVIIDDAEDVSSSCPTCGVQLDVVEVSTLSLIPPPADRPSEFQGSCKRLLRGPTNCTLASKHSRSSRHRSR